MFENSDEMLNSNSDLFDLTEADLLLPEQLTFPKNELIEGTVLDCQAMEKSSAVKMEVLLSNTDHAGKSHGFFINKPKQDKDGKINPTQKKVWVEFLLCFWTKEQVLKKEINLTDTVGKKISYRATEAREWQGKVYQNFNTFKVQE